MRSEGYPLRLTLAYLLWLMPLDTRLRPPAVARRLKLPGWLTRLVVAACLPPGACSAGCWDKPPSQIVAALDELPLAGAVRPFPGRRELGYTPAYHAGLRHRNGRFVQPHTSGHDLLARHIPPGPVYGQILEQLRAAWLDGQVNSAAEENSLLEGLIDG